MELVYTNEKFFILTDFILNKINFSLTQTVIIKSAVFFAQQKNALSITYRGFFGDGCHIIFTFAVERVNVLKINYQYTDMRMC